MTVFASRTSIYHCLASSSKVKVANNTLSASEQGNTSNNFSVSKTHASAFSGSRPPWNDGGFILLNFCVRAMISSLTFYSGCTGKGGACWFCCCLKASVNSSTVLSNLVILASDDSVSSAFLALSISL